MVAILEVIIGMIFIYVLLSILVTEVNTLFSNMLRLRGRNLREALNKIIDDPVMRAKIYTHPLIQLVEERSVLPTQRISAKDAEKIADGAIAAVDWIDSNTFVDVVLNNIKVESDQQLFGAMLNVIDGMPSGAERRGLRLIVNRIMTSGEGMDELRDAIANVDHPSFRHALMDTLDQIEDEITQLGLEPNSVVSVMAGIRQIDNPYFRNALSTILSTAQTMDEAKANIAKWFDNAMTQSSSTYATKMKTLSLFVALVIAVTANVDTLHVGRTLWEDPILREQLSVVASQAVESGQLGAAVTGAQQSNAQATDAQATDEGVIEDVVVSVDAVSQTLNDLNSLRLPIGWIHDDVSYAPADSPLRSNPNNIWLYSPWNNPSGWLGLLLTKIMGLTVTIISAAQGAPFWFNILNRITNR